MPECPRWEATSEHRSTAAGGRDGSLYDCRDGTWTRVGDHTPLWQGRLAIGMIARIGGIGVAITAWVLRLRQIFLPLMGGDNIPGWTCSPFPFGRLLPRTSDRRKACSPGTVPTIPRPLISFTASTLASSTTRSNGFRKSSPT